MHHHVICVPQRRHLDETLMAREKDGKGEDGGQSETGVVNRHRASQFHIRYFDVRVSGCFVCKHAMRCTC